MKQENKKQLKIYLILIIVLAVASAISVFLPIPSQFGDISQLPAPRIFIALANLGIIILIYGPLGLLGYYLARKLNWPGIFDEQKNWKKLILRPFYIGLIIGIFLIIAQKIFVLFHSLGELPHPGFPLSLIASLTAGIGEELIFRLFLLSFWAFILGLIFKKFNKQKTINWIAIIVAALAFGIGHFPAAMLFYGFTSISQVPIVFTIEILLLNGVVAVFAGREFIKYGFIAAIGIHFWVDVVWHVIYGLIS